MGTLAKHSDMQSVFETTDQLQVKDPILNLAVEFRRDLRPQKVNLGVGAYYNASGNPVTLKSVKQAEELLAQEESDKHYLPIEGSPAFVQHALALVFGENSSLLLQSKITGCQTIGGTGALRVGAEYLALNGTRTVYVSAPSWPNHRLIFERAGHRVETYPYYDATNRTVAFNSLLEAVLKMQSGDVIVLHASCHNPTGCDLTQEQWKELAKVIEERHIFPFFDIAYQGFGTNIDDDAFSVRHFANQGIPGFVAGSMAKNFGLYGERVGILAAVTQEMSLSAKVLMQLKMVIRGIYSSPVKHGGAIVAKILESPKLKSLWLQEVDEMRSRICAIRNQLIETLQSKHVYPEEVTEVLRNQRGLFCYGIIDPAWVEALQKRFGIYLPADGRINLGGLNESNIKFVLEGIQAVAKG